MSEEKHIEFIATRVPGYFEIALNGFRVGAIYRAGVVVSNSSTQIDRGPIRGLSKLLGLTEEEAREIFLRESARLRNGTRDE